MTGRLPALLMLILLATGCAVRQRAEVEEDLSRFMRGHEGCFVLKDTARDLIVRHNAARCSERFPPCSTFKIPNSLIGLETGAVPDAGHVIPWDGVVRDREDLNRDHTLRTAFRDSVVWYYQEVARRVGEERMRSWLRRLRYGNEDMSAGLTEFWLGSSLKISAEEQVRLVERLHRHALPFSRHTEDAVLDLMVAERTPAYTLRGKTGSARGRDGGPDLGWYVGSVETKGGMYYFAINISGRGARGRVAREIALDILRDRGTLPRNGGEAGATARPPW